MRVPLRGRLISSSFATDVFPSSPLFVTPPARVRRLMEHCASQVSERVGPSASIRAVADIAMVPLLSLLGLAPAMREDAPSICRIHTRYGSEAGPLVLVTGYGDSLDRAWRVAIHGAIANDARWCLCCNGRHLRVVDARRTWSRAYLEFDLAATLEDGDGQALLWSLLRRDAVSDRPCALDLAIQASARHGVSLCRALGHGVLDALELMLATLQIPGSDPAVVYEHSLTVLYRVLFLLFAEARGLVPLWHPVYRDRYSLETIVSTLLAGRPYRGLWHALQAISRLAHAGCSAGELKVTAFNGRLFSPAGAATFDRRAIPDPVMRSAIVAVSSTTSAASRPRTRISYRDIDVEQLGAVYEQVLDYEPGPAGTTLVRTRDARKASGAFYTPRALTAAIVRRTLEPLVRDRSAEQILRLRVVDPAMGSGAFLVAACRYLASVAEHARIAEGRWHPGDVTTADRALLRREIASRCLYGVDLNPMAVQLARLSLWLATLASDRPLSFLDHHLIAGDSLIGASPVDVQRQPTRQGRGHDRARDLPLFETGELHTSLSDAARVRTLLAVEPDDSAAIVHQKERTLAALTTAASAVNRWRRLLDAWCAGWFWDDEHPPTRGVFSELMQQILHDRSSLPDGIAKPLLQRADRIAAAHRFCHWPLVFPEVFKSGGFDAVIGNPPWDMVRGDSGDGRTRGNRRREARCATEFFRGSGVYVAEARAHANRYQLFVERSLQVLRPGGRLGLVLPSGIVSDTGSAALRRHLFDRACVDSITGMDNRGSIFPIHRSVRFALVTASAGARTERIACRFGLTSVDEIESPGRAILDLSRGLLERLSGRDDLGIPELACERDLLIVERISAYVPWLGSDAGWGVQFGRELNATDDRQAFRKRTGAPDARPVVEGKQLEPFRVDVARSGFELRPDTPAERRLPHRARVAYREVASATNRLTLIAAVLPASVVTTHTVFCLKNPLPLPYQRVLCALLNSFVANYLIRLRVSTHVTASLMARLPVPHITADRPAFERLDSLASLLARTSDVESSPEYAELQSLVAHLYGLTRTEFEHVLSTFPLIPESTRMASLERFRLESASR